MFIFMCILLHPEVAVLFCGLQAIFKEAGPTALVVVDFYKTACGACKYIMPGFIKLCKASATGHSSGEPPVVFVKHNVYDEDEGSVTALAKKYNIRVGDV